MTKPITYYSSLTDDSEIFNGLSLKFGSQFQCLTTAQKWAIILSLTKNFIAAQDDLPEELKEQLPQLSEDGALALIEAVASQIRSHRREEQRLNTRV